MEVRGYTSSKFDLKVILTVTYLRAGHVDLGYHCRQDRLGMKDVQRPELYPVLVDPRSRPKPTLERTKSETASRGNASHPRHLPKSW